MPLLFRSLYFFSAFVYANSFPALIIDYFFFTFSYLLPFRSSMMILISLIVADYLLLDYLIDVADMFMLTI